MKPERILVLRFSALGDVAMTLPVIYSVARHYPGVEVTVATRPFFAKLFINAPDNVKVIGIDFKGEYKGFGGMWRLLRKLGSFKPDAVADLHNVSRTWVIDSWFRMRGVRVAMVDKMRSTRKKLFTEGATQPDFVGRYADVFARLGLPVEPDFTSLFGNSHPAIPEPVVHLAVGVAPFARYFNKTYPAALMKEVIASLTAKGVNVYLFGGRGSEAEELERWANEINGCRSVAGRFPISEELALMAEMDVMVSMDSANQHLASLVGTPVVSVWGSTTPACGFKAYGQDLGNAVMAGVECQPCSVAGKPECPKGHFDCMNRLSPASIVNRVIDNLPAEGLS